MTHPTPAPGQIWADNDWRNAGRTIRIDQTDDTHATCTVLTNRTQAQQELDQGTGWSTDARGRTTRVLLRRFRPTSTGYRLVQHADGTPAEGSNEQ
jgi:hypothetical protein